ncbi:MAG: glycosyltransferase family 2 protein [Acidimicrobiales bacterium]
MSSAREPTAPDAAPAADLSVVISTHDRPAGVREAIDAARAQDHPGPIEILVVWDKAEPEWELADDDPHRRVRVLGNDRTSGLTGSRNTGAAAATAPVLGFCDDDDLWLVPKARRQLELLRSSGADVVVSGIEILVGGRRVPRPGTDTPLRFADLLRSRHLEACMVTALVRREAFWDRIGPMAEDLPGGYAEDYEWMLRASRLAPVPVVAEPLVAVRWADDASHYRQRWVDWEAALGVVLDRNPEFAAVPRGRARVEGQRAVAIAAQGRRGDAVAQIRTTLGWSAREPRAYLAALVAAGVPADLLTRALNRLGRGI